MQFLAKPNFSSRLTTFPGQVQFDMMLIAIIKSESYSSAASKYYIAVY